VESLLFTSGKFPVHQWKVFLCGGAHLQIEISGWSTWNVTTNTHSAVVEKVLSIPELLWGALFIFNMRPQLDATNFGFLLLIKEE